MNKFSLLTPNAVEANSEEEPFKTGHVTLKSSEMQLMSRTAGKNCSSAIFAVLPAELQAKIAVSRVVGSFFKRKTNQFLK